MRNPHAWIWVKFGHLFDAVSAKRVMKSDWKAKGIPFCRAREIVKLSDYAKCNNKLFIDNEHYNRNWLKKYSMESLFLG